jgi:hypothetical protein
MSNKKSNQNKFIKIPKKLYKYRPLSKTVNFIRALDEIKNNDVWVTNSTMFNDIFDSRTPVDLSVFLEKFDEGIKHCLSLTRLSVFEKKLLRAFAIKKMRPEFEEIGFKFGGKNNNKFSVCCFSKTLYSVPMWYHYADKYQGICIEYDMSKLSSDNELLKNLYPIKYKKPAAGIVYNNLGEVIEVNDNATMSLITKNKDWSYEKEWRLILPSKKGINGYKHIFSPISAVYMGTNIHSETERELKKVISNKGNCRLYKMIRTGMLDFSYEPIDIKM